MLKSIIILLALLLAVLMAGIQGQYVPSSSDETQQEEERTVQTEGPVSHDPTTILATAAPTPSPTAGLPSANEGALYADRSAYRAPARQGRE